jgi:hypothetical protein
MWHERPCRWKLAQPMLWPVRHAVLYSVFAARGNPDHAWKSRIFNNLAYAFAVG